MIIVICIIILFYYYPYFGYWQVQKGMSESEVESLMGPPKYNNKFTMGEPFFGYTPDLPDGTEFMAWNHFFRGERTIIIFISPDDYGNLTNNSKNTNDWIVWEKSIEPDYIIH